MALSPGVKIILSVFSVLVLLAALSLFYPDIRGLDKEQTTNSTKEEVDEQTGIPFDSAVSLLNNPTTDSIFIAKESAIPTSDPLSVIQEGDLLSTLLVNQGTLYTLEGSAEKKIPLKLSVYTKEYLTKLKNDFNDFVHQQNQADFYASSVQHLADSIDISAGKIGRGSKNEIALLRVGDTVYALEKPIRVFDLGTGGSYSACKARLRNKEILWTCFGGFSLDEAGEMTGLKMSETRYSLTGKKIATREYTE